VISKGASREVPTLMKTLAFEIGLPSNLVIKRQLLDVRSALMRIV